MKVRVKKHIKKFNIKNVWLMIVFTSSIGLILHDLYMLVIYPFVSNRLTGFTGFGLLTFVIAMYYACNLGEYFYEKIR